MPATPVRHRKEETSQLSLLHLSTGKTQGPGQPFLCHRRADFPSTAPRKSLPFPRQPAPASPAASGGAGSSARTWQPAPGSGRIRGSSLCPAASQNRDCKQQSRGCTELLSALWLYLTARALLAGRAREGVFPLSNSFQKSI